MLNLFYKFLRLELLTEETGESALKVFFLDACKQTFSLIFSPKLNPVSIN